MSFELGALFLLAAGYLGLLFGIAYLTDRGIIPKRLARHPVVYVLSLGVFASVWSYYAATGNAYRDGFGYLAPFIGISLAFLLSPILLKPILKLTRQYQLSSLADLLAFRYRNPWAGTATTVVMLIAVMPLLSLQIQAVANTVAMLAPDAPERVLAIAFCALITLFAILFGTGRGSSRERHEGLVMAIAFESLVKLLCLLALGLFAVYAGFGGFGAMEQWLQSRPDLLARIKEPAPPGTFQVMGLLFFTAAVATPHMFYMIFNENHNPRALTVASWALPLYFLLLSLPVLPILWAGLNVGSQAEMEYFPASLGMDHGYPLFSLIGFLGGLSAASGLIIVITLALSTMCLNHLILPLRQPSAEQDIYRWLLWKRRLLITALIWGGFLFYAIPGDALNIRAMSNVGLIASLQFLPSIIALLYWPRGNLKGFLAGLSGGVGIWLVLLVLPVTGGLEFLAPGNMETREIIALSLICNISLFVLISLLTRSNEEEKVSAEICSMDTLRHQSRPDFSGGSPQEFIQRLTQPLGERTARREVMQALNDLNLAHTERSPYSMRLLRGRIEANLSGLLGPAIAHDLVTRFIPQRTEQDSSTTDVAAIESRIEAYRSNLSGMAADLDHLRRYHRQILMDLPIGVCSLGGEQKIVMWNRAMEQMTGIGQSRAAGLTLDQLEPPWSRLIRDFLDSDRMHEHKTSVQLEGNRRVFSLHKSNIDQGNNSQMAQDGTIILLEDLTDTELLEEELAHSERLASIGRLAAGVAHEIGNPITGIACLAQNIRDEAEHDELRLMARQIIEQTDRTSRIVQSLVNFAHSGSHRTERISEPVLIRECVSEALTLVSLSKKERDVQFEAQCDGGQRILGDSQALLQVLVNLLNNARDASPDGGLIRIGCERVKARVEISITDQGSGIPESLKDRIFEPFFTTKEPGEGTGLGLSLVYSIVENLDGHIDIMDAASGAENPGTKVILSFPCYDESSLQ